MANVQVEASEYYLSLSFRKHQEGIEKTSEELSALFAGLSHESALETLQNFVTKLQILLKADCLPEGVSKYYELHKLTVNCHDAKAEKILNAEERAWKATLHAKALNEVRQDQIYAEKFRKRISESVSQSGDTDLLLGFNEAMNVYVAGAILDANKLQESPFSEKV